jgi:hypothetical protein
MSITVPYGYNAGIPDDAKAAWGARLIVNQDGMVDLLPDRQGFAEGSDPTVKQWLTEHLNGKVGRRPLGALADMLRSGEVDTRSDAEHIVFDDGTVRLVGSAQDSAGYFYIVAFPVTHSDVCVFCETPLTRLGNVWVDDTHGDCCPGAADGTGENGSHVAAGAEKFWSQR